MTSKFKHFFALIQVLRETPGRIAGTDRFSGITLPQTGKYIPADSSEKIPENSPD